MVYSQLQPNAIDAQSIPLKARNELLVHGFQTANDTGHLTGENDAV